MTKTPVWSMNLYLNSSSQKHPSSANTGASSAAAAQHETDTAAVHELPQEINSNMWLNPLKPSDGGNKKSVESSDTLYFPLPGKQ